MQVYKLFMKILHGQLGQIIMYIGIFVGLIIIISNQKVADTNTSYQMSSLDVAISDKDNSTTSKAIIDYIDANNNIVEISDYEKETIQDELFNRNIVAAISIPEGFEAMITSGKTDNILDIYSIPGTMAADIISSELNNYIGYLAAFMESGNRADAIASANDITDIHADVTMLNGKASDKDIMYYYFSYLAYIFICIVFVGATPILIVLNRDVIRARINISAYRQSKVNRETAYGLATFGVVISAVFIIVSTIISKGDVFSTKGLLYISNMIIYMIMAIGLAFFVGQLISKENMISMVANVIGLGFSFLGGVFVPLEFMGEGIIKIAHFLPSYWYILAAGFINSYSDGAELSQLFGYLGIELIFAVTFFIAGGVAIKAKKSM